MGYLAKSRVHLNELTSDVKPPSHFPIFGWRHQRVLSYKQEGRLFYTPEMEREALGEPFTLHGLLWPQQLDSLQNLRKTGSVHTAGPPITDGRMLRRMHKTNIVTLSQGSNANS
jgi:hypothetical protein